MKVEVNESTLVAAAVYQLAHGTMKNSVIADDVLANLEILHPQSQQVIRNELERLYEQEPLAPHWLRVLAALKEAK